MTIPKKFLFFLAICALVSLVIIPAVSAESYSGTITRSAYITTDQFTLANANTAGNFQYPDDLWVYDIENTFDGLTYILANAESGGGYYVYGGILAPDAASTSVTGTVGGLTVFTGTIGYNINRVTPKFSSLFIDLGNTVNIGTLTGNQLINLTYSSTAINNFTLPSPGEAGGGPSSTWPIELISRHEGSTKYIQQGNAWYTRARAFENDWSVSKDTVTGKTNINVTKIFGSTKYPSIVNISSGTTVFYDDGSLNRVNVGTITFLSPVTLRITDFLGRLWSQKFFASNYTFSVDPASINNGATITARLGSSNGLFTDLIGTTYNYIDPDGTKKPLVDPENSDYMQTYDLRGGHWYQYDLATHTSLIDKGTTLPNPIYATADWGPGAYTIECYLYKDDGDIQRLTAPLSISTTAANNTQKLTIMAMDYLYGNLIEGAAIHVKNLGTGIWTNRTGASTGAEDFYYPYYSNLYIEATAGGYLPANRNWQVTGVPVDSVSLIMYPGVTPPITNTSLFVSIFNGATGAGLEGAMVTLSDGQFKITPNSGVATFTVLNGSTYQISASKTGFVTGTKSATTSTSMLEVSILLQRQTTPTPTPYPTPSPFPTAITPTPIVTVPGYQPAQGNFTGFWAPFMNAAVAMGANPGEVGILMALVLTFAGLVIGSIGPSMFVGAIVINPIGGEIGAILGIVGSIAFGFFPLYLAIIAVVGLILYVSLRVYGVTH